MHAYVQDIGDPMNAKRSMNVNQTNARGLSDSTVSIDHTINNHGASDTAAICARYTTFPSRTL